MDNLKANGGATADTAEAEGKVQAAAGLGKFKDVQTLMKAYSDLEAEFTRRSQRLKELEQRNKAETLPDGEKVSPSRTEDELVTYALSNDKVKDAVIGEYLKGISESKAPTILTGGSGVSAPRVTPKTVREAGRLAREFLKG